MSSRRWDAFWDVVCGLQSVTVSLYMINLVFLILIAFLFVIGDPTGEAYTLLLVDLAIVAPSTVLLGVILYKCRGG